MKFLIVGAWQSSWYEGALAKALTDLGHIVRGFNYSKYFFDGWKAEHVARHKSLSSRLQNRLIWGPLIQRLNRDLVQECCTVRPDVCFNYNATHVLRSSLVDIRRNLPNAVLVQYSNDNPFSPQADLLHWRHLRRCVPLFDMNFVYRQSNKVDILRYGGQNVELLRSAYVPETDFRVELTSADSEFRSDILFAGHFENDGRLELLEAVAALDFRFRLFGGTWGPAEREISSQSPLAKHFPVRALSRADYRKAISGTKIALCFLSGLNCDTYTRRSFEIPAMQAFMLSQYSEDLATLFEPGVEAEYFRSKEELLEKVRYYATHDREREAIARNGNARLIRDGHDILSRARQIVQMITSKATS